MTAIELLNTVPPVKLDDQCATMPKSDLATLANHMGELSALAAGYAAYLDARSIGLSHDKAAESFNNTIERSRRATGYTYPASGRINF